MPRRHAEEDDLPGKAPHEAEPIHDVGEEGRIVADVVVAREGGQRRARVPAREPEQGEEQAGARVAVPWLHEQVRGRKSAQLLRGEGEMVSVHDRERAGRRDQGLDPGERRLEHRPLTGQATVLLRNRPAGQLASQSLETEPVTPGQQEPQQVICGRQSHVCG